MAIEPIEEGMTGLEARQIILANDQENETAASDALDRADEVDEATKAAQQVRFISQMFAKGGFLDVDGRPLLIIDRDDNIDAAGLSAHLLEAIAPLLKTLILPIIESGQSMGGFMDKDGRLLLSFNKQGRAEVELENLRFISNPVYLGGWIDRDGRILLGIKRNGTIDGIFSNDAKIAELAALIQATVSTLITCFGDSQTQGQAFMGFTPWPEQLQALIGSDYTVLNNGVGGENVPTISFRQGGVPAIIQNGFTLPAGTAPVAIGAMLTTINGTTINPLIQGDGNSVNPVFVEDVECTLTLTSGTYYLARNVADASTRAIPAGALIHTKAAKMYRNTKAATYFMGQNLGYTSIANLIDYYKRLIAYNGTKYYCVIGLLTGTPAERADLENAMTAEFGLHYINLRRYLSSNALYDIGLTPTTADLAAMAAGTFPPSLWLTPTDAVHLNQYGNQAIALAVFNNLKQQGTF